MSVLTHIDRSCRRCLRRYDVVLHPIGTVRELRRYDPQQYEVFVSDSRADGIQVVLVAMRSVSGFPETIDLTRFEVSLY